jgi:hypothetical protein
MAQRQGSNVRLVIDVYKNLGTLPYMKLDWQLIRWVFIALAIGTALTELFVLTFL